jgi:hypothetical protein
MVTTVAASGYRDGRVMGSSSDALQCIPYGRRIVREDKIDPETEQPGQCISVVHGIDAHTHAFRVCSIDHGMAYTRAAAKDVRSVEAPGDKDRTAYEIPDRMEKDPDREGGCATTERAQEAVIER